MKENNDNYDFLSNEDFEQWENDFPKLPKTEVSFPDKHKLYKFEKRKKPQWTWYAAAACFVLGMLVFLPRIEREDAVLVADVVEIIENEIEQRYEVCDGVSPAGGGQGGGITQLANAHPRPYGTPPPAGDIRRGEPTCSPVHTIATIACRGRVCLPPSDIAINANEGGQTPPLQEIATIQSITNIQIPIEMNLAENRQILRFAQDDNVIVGDDRLQERLELAINDFVITPAKTVIHTITRRFFERRTEVELFLEEQEFPRFFARHRDVNMQEL